MSIQAKQSLIKDITRDIDVYLPKVESDMVINTINDNLVNYDVEEVTVAHVAVVVPDHIAPVLHELAQEIMLRDLFEPCHSSFLSFP